MFAINTDVHVIGADLELGVLVGGFTVDDIIYIAGARCGHACRPDAAKYDKAETATEHDQHERRGVA